MWPFVSGLFLFSIMSLRFVSAWHVSVLCSFLLLSVFHCMAIDHLVLSVDGHTGYLQFGAIMSNGINVINVYIQVFV